MKIFILINSLRPTYHWPHFLSIKFCTDSCITIRMKEMLQTPFNTYVMLLTPLTSRFSQRVNLCKWQFLEPCFHMMARMPIFQMKTLPHQLRFHSTWLLQSGNTIQRPVSTYVCWQWRLWGAGRRNTLFNSHRVKQDPRASIARTRFPRS